MRDWVEFSLRILVDAPLEDVFSHWARADLLGRWFVKASHQDDDGKPWPESQPIKEGCRYRWAWANGFTEEGEFTQIEEPNLIAFTFGTDVGVVVRFGIHNGRTLVELKQTHGQDSLEDRAAYYADCQQGWTFFLANLRSVLQGGLDLREFDETEIANVNV